MNRFLRLTTLCLGLATLPALAAEACPWAGGAYKFRDHGVYGDFTVNANCTQLVWSRLTDEPETTALERTKHGWKGELSKASFVLLENGTSLRITGVGGVMRQSNNVTRQN